MSRRGRGSTADGRPAWSPPGVNLSRGRASGAGVRRRRVPPTRLTYPRPGSPRDVQATPPPLLPHTEVQTSPRLAGQGRERNPATPLPPRTVHEERWQTTPGQTEGEGTGRALDLAFQAAESAVRSGAHRTLVSQGVGPAAQQWAQHAGGATLGGVAAGLGAAVAGPAGAAIGGAIGHRVGSDLTGSAIRGAGNLVRTGSLSGRKRPRVIQAGELRAAARRQFERGQAAYEMAVANQPAPVHHSTLIDSGMPSNPRSSDPSPLGHVQQPYMSTTFRGNDAWFDKTAPSGVPFTAKPRTISTLAPAIRRPKGVGRWSIDPNSGLPFAGIKRLKTTHVPHPISTAQAVV